MPAFFNKLTRRQVNLKREDEREINEDEESHLERRLNLPSLIFLNVSCSIGSGIYVLTGIASSSYSGPFTFLSYLLAGIACLFSAFCFAEFASRIKSTSGSSYSFVYYSIGEFFAFVIGWLIFTGSVTSIAAISLTWSSYLDSLTDNYIKNFTIEVLHLKWNPDKVAPFSTHLDIPACLITICFFCISLRGIQASVLFNNTIAILNITILTVISIGAAFYGHVENLSTDHYTNGFNGVIRGASIVMFAYLGFESSSFAINETVNPTKNVPASLIISIFIIVLTYCTSSLALNLMQPFDQIDPHAPFPTAFRSTPRPLYSIVSVGPLISLSGALFTSIYSTARIVYTMANDGLLFAPLAAISSRTHVPHTATLFTLFLSVLLIIVIDVPGLVGFTDITGFLTYSLTALALLTVRYYNEDCNQETENDGSLAESSIDDNSTSLLNSNERENDENDDEQHLISNLQQTKPKSGILANIRRWKFFRTRDNCLFIILHLYLSNIVYFGLLHYLPSIKTFLIALIILTNLIYIAVLGIFKQIRPPKTLSFKVPFVPVIPILVIVLNTYIMMASEKIEWIVFGCILLLGLPIYFFYGLRHSKLNAIVSSL